MYQIEAVISDADGTLVDTVSLIRHGQYETAATFLQQHGIPANEIPPYEDYETLLNRLVGGSARQTLERTVRALYENQAHHLEGMDYDKLNSLLDPIQDRLAPEYVTAFPGLSDTLSKIGKLGVKLAIFSSGTPHHIVRNFGIALAGDVKDHTKLYQDETMDDQTKLDRFTEQVQDAFHLPLLTVVTCEDVGEYTKPDPMSVQIAMNRLDVNPSNTLLLGDHAYDMQAGVNAGIEMRVGITHGFDDEASLRQAGASEVIASLRDLPSLLIE